MESKFGKFVNENKWFIVPLTRTCSPCKIIYQSIIHAYSDL